MTNFPYDIEVKPTVTPQEAREALAHISGIDDWDWFENCSGKTCKQIRVNLIRRLLEERAGSEEV